MRYELRARPLIWLYFKCRWESCFLLWPSVLTPSARQPIGQHMKSTGPVWSKDNVSLLKFWIVRFWNQREKVINEGTFMGRVHSMLSSSHTKACEHYWPITFKLKAPKAKHYITPRLINKLTPSESKLSKITLHQTGPCHICSLFLISWTRPQDLAGIPGQWCNYWVLIVFDEVWEILSYFWTWNTMVFISDWAWGKKAKHLQMEALS